MSGEEFELFTSAESAPVGADEVPLGVLRWHVLQNRSRQEKALAESLAARWIRHFLSLVEVARSYGGRWSTVELPLSPYYLFLRGTMEEVYTADRAFSVARASHAFDQPPILHRTPRQVKKSASVDAPPVLLAVEFRRLHGIMTSMITTHNYALISASVKVYGRPMNTLKLWLHQDIPVLYSCR